MHPGDLLGVGADGSTPDGYGYRVNVLLGTGSFGQVVLCCKTTVEDGGGDGITMVVVGGGGSGGGAGEPDVEVAIKVAKCLPGFDARSKVSRVRAVSHGTHSLVAL
jgi:hypothetical protein